MLSKEENDLLTRVSNGAPMGEMIKQNWWIPAALSEKLVADGKPLRVQLFGEPFVAFRATNGKVGFFEEGCPHRRASLALGRNEDNSLRCIYHGWKFHVDGMTVAVPTQPNNEAEYCKHVPLVHYPVREEAGMIWVWLGKGDTPPAFPELPVVGLPRENFTVFRQKVNANWLQGVETTMDSAHLGVLHQSWLVGFGDIEFSSANMAPVYHIAQKPYGFRYAAVRALQDGRSYVRTNSFVMPWYGIVSPNQTDIKGGSMFFSVPIDDENIYYYQIASAARSARGQLGAGSRSDEAGALHRLHANARHRGLRGHDQHGADRRPDQGISRRRRRRGARGASLPAEVGARIHGQLRADARAS